MVASAAILFASTGILAFWLRLQIFNPGWYQQAIDQSHLYSSVAAFAKDDGLSQLFTPVEYSELQIDYSGLVRPAIGVVLDQIEIETLLQLVIENNLSHVLLWLDGQDDQLYIYFPKTYLLENIDTATLLNQLDVEVISTYKRLATCTGQQEQDLLAADTLNIARLPCMPAAGKAYLAEFEGRISSLDSQGLFEYVLNEGELAMLSERTPISSLFEADVDFLMCSRQIQEYVALSAWVAPTFMIIGLILSALVTFLSDHKLRTLSKLSLMVGLILALIGATVSAVLGGLVPELLTHMPELSRFGSLSESVANLMQLLIQGMFNPVLAMGSVLAVVSFMVFIVLTVLARGKAAVTGEEDK